MSWTRPSPRPACARFGQADLADLVLPAAQRADLGNAVTEGFGSGPISSCLTNAGFMNEHVEELGEPIVQASTQAAMAYLGDPHAPDRPHYLETWAKYLRGLDPAHKPLITKELVDYWCMYGGPADVREQTQLMLANGVDLVSVFLSNPFTAERDVDDIGNSILAAA